MRNQSLNLIFKTCLQLRKTLGKPDQELALIEGDRKCIFLSHKASQWQKRNSITLLKHANGMDITNPLEIEQVVLDYFQSIYTSNYLTCVLQDGMTGQTLFNKLNLCLNPFSLWKFWKL